MKLIILLGPPGAGKGTHAVRLARQTGLVHISTGDLLRQEIRQATVLGTKAKSYMDAGQLVPDELIIAMLEQRLLREDCSQHGVLLDGFPRTVAQAEALDQSFAARCKMLIVELQVSEEQLVERLTGRISCPLCGTPYHRTFCPPQHDSVCDRDGTALVQRADDNEKAVKARLQVYSEQTRPVVDFYRDRHPYVIIDASRSADAIYPDLYSAVINVIY